MDSSDEILSFLDLLDLDEELIDKRLNSIMLRINHSNDHLKNALQLLQYKHLINTREDSECENKRECDFVVQLIQNAHDENLKYICKILKIVLRLNPSTIVSKSEHILQQILSNMALPDKPETEFNDNNKNIILNLEITNSILDAVISSNEKISLLFLTNPLENILYCNNDKVKFYFLTSTVPKLFECILGYRILDRIWDHITILQLNNNEACLKIMSCLSDYYLPSFDAQGNAKFESVIAMKSEFWSMILLGLNSNDTSIRRIAIYLGKRAIDNLMFLKMDFRASNDDFIIFFWEHKNAITHKKNWENYFILIESLEETQSNIVLPSIQLFDSLKHIGNHWLNCCFNIGLKHDNTEVRLRCIENRLKVKFCSRNEAITLLEALNDLNIYHNSKEYRLLKESISKCLLDSDCLESVINVIPNIKWSPVPLYHLSYVLGEIKLQNPVNFRIFCDKIKEILKLHCTNIPIRKAVYINISHFIANNCYGIDWESYGNIYPLFHFELFENQSLNTNPFILLVNTMSVEKDEEHDFFKFITKSYENIDFALLYLKQNDKNRDIFIEEIASKLKNVGEVISRQYCDKLECFRDVIYLINIHTKTLKDENSFMKTLNMMISKEYSVILHYILELLMSDVVLSIEELKVLLKDQTIMIYNTDNNCAHILLHLFKSSILLLNDENTNIFKKAFSLTVIDCLVFENLANNSVLLNHVDNILTEVEIVKFGEMDTINNAENVSKFKNIFHEESCILIYKIMNKKILNVKTIVKYVEKVIDCGGYGCLKWILKIIKKVLKKLLNDDTIQFDIPQFLNRSWKEIEELKSNSQYTPCIEEFVNIITDDDLLMKLSNNIIVFYCSKIIEYGPARNISLYFLTRQLNKKEILTSELVYVICEILLYNPVLKKDQRTIENIEIDIKNNGKFKLKDKSFRNHHNYEIQYLALSTLSKINDLETLKIIINIFMNKMNEVFKNKVRYHGNSQTHRLIATALQNTLFIALLDSRTIDDGAMDWCLKLLGKLPHQASVKIYLEWHISLCLYLKKIILNEDLQKLLGSYNIPISSQFMILYWLMKRKLSTKRFVNDEYDFVMDTLLSHTMGQMFNTRLHAQYLAADLYRRNEIHAAKYEYTIRVIEKTFAESKRDKNFLKLKNDYFVNNFDIINNLTPYFIYECSSKLSDATLNEVKDLETVKHQLNVINENIKIDKGDDLKTEWLRGHASDEEFEEYERICVLNQREDYSKECVGTIQKKYIPWKNMSDVNSYDHSKKKEIIGDLIVVASLVDKLPNLGGMARTSEVFGVRSYVVGSLRHLQDKQFQGLSVSAERWIDVEEVRPGQPLKEFLANKKSEGYSVVAAEQTSTSVKLESFKFPKKTVLLLGHEKEGVPCDLLPLMDQCVEIPQRGVVRSLNVHVAAAIFVWEYTRQNVL